MIVFSFILTIILGYLLLSTALPFVLSMAGTLFDEITLRKVSKFRKLLVLVPAYKEDAVIVDTALNSLKQDYPKDLYDVVIIADGLSDKTIQELSEIDVITSVVSFKKSTKVKALNHAIRQHMDDTYEGVAVLDADNVMDDQFLARINEGLELGMVAIQGQRKAKNSDCDIAFLDGVSEAINNHIYCHGASRLGLSSRLAGSGMAFLPHLLRSSLEKSQAIGGFDKELELILTAQRTRIHYLPKAIVYDEKVRNRKAFTNQRARWIQAQYFYLTHHLKYGLWNGIKTGNADYLIKVFLLSLPPRLLFPIILFACAVSSTIYFGGNGIACLLWMFLILNFTSFIIAIPSSYFKKDSIYKWGGLFSAVIQTIKALTKTSKARHTFLHTSHGTISSNNQNLE